MKGLNFVMTYMKQNKKHKKTLKSAQYRLENIFKPVILLEGFQQEGILFFHEQENLLELNFVITDNNFLPCGRTQQAN